MFCAYSCTLWPTYTVYQRMSWKNKCAQFFSMIVFKVYTHFCTKTSTTSTYYPRKNGQVKRKKKKYLRCLRYNVAHQERDWDTYVQSITYAYNTKVQFPARTTATSLSCQVAFLYQQRPPTLPRCHGTLIFQREAQPLRMRLFLRITAWRLPVSIILTSTDTPNIGKNDKSPKKSCEVTGTAFLISAIYRWMPFQIDVLTKSLQRHTTNLCRKQLEHEWRLKLKFLR